VALIARELRCLLLARDCLTESLGRSGIPVTYATFQSRLLPLLSEAQREAFGTCIRMRSTCAAAARQTARLQRGVIRLQELDLRLKSSSPIPPRTGGVVLDLCR